MQQSAKQIRPINLQKYRKYGVKKRPSGIFTKGWRLMSLSEVLSLWLLGLLLGMVIPTATQALLIPSDPTGLGAATGLSFLPWFQIGLLLFVAGSVVYSARRPREAPEGEQVGTE